MKSSKERCSPPRTDEAELFGLPIDVALRLPPVTDPYSCDQWDAIGVLMALGEARAAAALLVAAERGADHARAAALVGAGVLTDQPAEPLAPPPLTSAATALAPPADPATAHARVAGRT